MTQPKYVYFFGAGEGEGNATMRLLLGGKGANLAEMTNLGVSCPGLQSPGLQSPLKYANTIMITIKSTPVVLTNRLPRTYKK